MSTPGTAEGIASAGLSSFLLTLPYWTQFLEIGAHIIVTVCGVIIGILGAWRQIRHVQANRQHAAQRKRKP